MSDQCGFFIKFNIKLSKRGSIEDFRGFLRSILRSVPLRWILIWMGIEYFSELPDIVTIKLYFIKPKMMRLKPCNPYKKIKIHRANDEGEGRKSTKAKSAQIQLIQQQDNKKMLATVGLNYCRRRYYDFVGLTIRHRKLRWSFTLLIAAIYLYRAVGLSYDVITYLIGFYFLQLLVSYLTPKGLDEDEPEEQYDEITGNFIIEAVDTSSLPDFNSQFEFENRAQSEKPLISSMSESQIWERITFAFILGIICTMFKAIEIDVFWPLLMFYFVVLVCYTVHKIAKKMQKYNYSISDFNKRGNIGFTSPLNFAQ